jgi:GNAT superfamily N-acetyltransferase
VQFCEAAAEDAGRIAALHADSWQRHYRHSWPNDYLDGPVVEDRRKIWLMRLVEPKANQFVLLAEEGDELVGFACAFGGDDPDYGTLLDNLHVRHDQQGRGTGAELVRRVARWTRDHYPDKPLFLWALEKNTGARRLYERLGAENAGTEAHPTPGGGVANAVRYVWPDLDALVG